MSIFIQIAAYRDPELIKTIQSCIQNSKQPANLRFGICHQQSDDDAFSQELSAYQSDSRFRIVNVPFKESKGACWARHKIQEMQQGEDQTLQIDSHMRFANDWDSTLIHLLMQCQADGHPKPLITAQAPSQEPDHDPDGRVKEPWRMAYDKFTPEGCVFFLPEVIPNWQMLEKPIRARFQSAHFAFTLGQFCQEVPHDPEYYFHGEEISIAVRAFTHGYDLFHPHIIIVWHEQTRKGRTKQWDDDPSWHLKNDATHTKNRELLKVDCNPKEYCNFDVSKYGFGTQRSLRDQERQAGLCFGTRKFHSQTLAHRDPPDKNVQFLTDDQWLASFSRFKSTFKTLTTPVAKPLGTQCTPSTIIEPKAS